jgi:hypothetical protein
VQPLKNFSWFYETRRFITVFTKALYWSIFWARSTHPISLHRISLGPIYHLRLGLPSGLVPFGIPTNILYAFIFSSFMLHSLPIQFSFTLSFWVYLGKSTSYEAPHYTVFSNLPSLHPSSIQTFPSALCFWTPSVHVALLMPEIKFHTHTEPQAKLYFCIF